MPYFSNQPTVLLTRLRDPLRCILRLLTPILVIYCVPSEQSVVESLFLGEGCCRICCSVWTFRHSLPLLLKKTGGFSSAFAFEEIVQEICLRILI